jgi:hypothetical protein
MNGNGKMAERLRRVTQALVLTNLVGFS